MNTKYSSSHGGQHGFTLVEIAVAIAIMGFLLGGAVITLSAQMDLRNRTETQRALEDARDALLGYTIAKGRLPCPAKSDSNGMAAPEVGLDGSCFAKPGATTIGYLPAATLGLGPTDSAGFLVDAWGNRIRYTVTASNSAAFTTSDEMRTIGVNSLNPNLEVCSAATVGDASCPTSTRLTNQSVAVIYSLGKNGGASTPPTDDEKANTDGGKVFVSASNSSFDDIVLWLSPYTLYNRMIAAGAL